MTKKCKGTISFGDDYGDPSPIFQCVLPDGHDGAHVTNGDRYGKLYELTWDDKKY